MSTASLTAPRVTSRKKATKPRFFADVDGIYGVLLPGEVAVCKYHGEGAYVLSTHRSMGPAQRRKLALEGQHKGLHLVGRPCCASVARMKTRQRAT